MNRPSEGDGQPRHVRAAGIRTQPHEPYNPIGDYALIGDCRTAALVSRDGSIDWCCLPNFNSPSFFGRLLDSRQGGHFAIRPVEPFQGEQRYTEGTNVLTTVFTTPSGSVRLTDFMPAVPSSVEHRMLLPLRQIIRCIEGVAGSVDMELIFAPRPNYGLVRQRLRSRSAYSVTLQRKNWFLHLASDRPLEVQGERARARFQVSAGEHSTVSMAYDEDTPATLPATGGQAFRLLEETVRVWRRWLEPCDYEGPYASYVQRSALLLKLLEFAPSGAIVAAPTASLPEKVGGVRNWDYRFCWLRDASMTVGALRALGFTEEAGAFLNWMLHTTRLTQPRLQVVYDVYGGASLPQQEMDHLEGYKGSRPVRIGNQAADQDQLDVYGEVLEGVFEAGPLAQTLSRETRRLIQGAANHVAAHWQEPGNGIWEMQDRRQFTHSKMLARVALLRAEQLLSPYGVSRRSARRWREAGNAIDGLISERGFNREIGAFVMELDGRDLDASALAYPLVGGIDARDPRMVSTVRVVRERLSVDGLVFRYLTDDGLPPGEGTFVVCAFWLVRCLALQGEVDAAAGMMERILACTNHVGLLSEEIDPSSRAALGNFPQGLSHIGLINAAVEIERARAHASG